MEPPQGRQANEDAQRYRECFCLVGALSFQNIFPKKTPEALPTVVAVEHFLTVDGALQVIHFFDDAQN